MGSSARVSGWIREKLSTTSELDPRRVERVRRKYDEDSGYREFHQACCTRSGLDLAPEIGEPGQRGFEHLRVMSGETASGLLREVLAGFELGPVKKDKAELRGYQIDDHGFRERVLEAALVAPVHERIEHCFGSHYRVHWYFVTCTDPGEGTYSFRWHCDKGPTQHLKLLVYLNDDSEHGGNTELLDLQTSEAIARVGYSFGPTRSRREDLSSLAARAEARYQPVRRAMSAGEGILFQPARVLHRGISPTRGPRYVLTLCLLPSPVPWREALRGGGMFDLRQDAKWHRNARTLLQSAQLR
jgi:hypothetical protein